MKIIHTNEGEMMRYPFHNGFYRWLRKQCDLQEDAELDCRKIEVPEDIRKVWEYAMLRDYPDLPSREVRTQLNQLLLLYGPKANLDASMEIHIEL